MNIKYDPILGSLRESDENYDLEIDFLDLTPYVYTCPVAMKFVSIEYENDEPDVSVSYNEELEKYLKVTITPTTVGLVILKGVKL